MRKRGISLNFRNTFEEQNTVSLICWIASHKKTRRRLHLGTVNVTVFGKRVFAHGIKLGGGHIELGWVLSRYDGHLCKKRRHTDTGEEIRWQWRQRLQWCIYQSKDIKDCQKHQKLSKEQMFPQDLQGQRGPADTTISDFQPPAPWGWTSVTVGPPTVVRCYSSLGNLCATVCSSTPNPKHTKLVFLQWSRHHWII